MPAQLVVQLVAQVGIPLTAQLISLWEQGGTVSKAQFDALVASASVTARQQVINCLNTLGVPLTDPKAVAILTQVPV